MRLTRVIGDKAAAVADDEKSKKGKTMTIRNAVEQKKQEILAAQAVAGGYVLCHAIVLMFTLDQTTLFYHDFAHSSKRTGMIKNWAETVQQFTTSQAKVSGSESKSSKSAPTLINSVSNQRTSKASTSTDAPSLIDVDNYSGGVADLDETVGPEQQAAVNSPLKNGIRPTSIVIILSLLFRNTD
jgi:hypothetical protein